MDSKEIPDMSDETKWHKETINFRIISDRIEYNNIVDAINTKSSATLIYKMMGKNQFVFVKYPTGYVEAYIFDFERI